jgi:hypothetical protein
MRCASGALALTVGFTRQPTLDFQHLCRSMPEMDVASMASFHDPQYAFHSVSSHPCSWVLTSVRARFSAVVTKLIESRLRASAST